VVRTLVRALALLATPALLLAQTPDSTRRDTTARATPLSSGAHITRARLDSLPIDDPASAFAQIPGVFLRGGDVGLLSGASLSIRGGLPNGAATFVDGAPVRSFITGNAFLTPALNGIADIDVTTGLGGAELSDIQNGVIEYQTPAGSERFQSHFAAHTDNPFGSVASVGYNRFAGDVSGPLGMPGLTFFASGMLQGQSSPYLGFGAQNVPIFEQGGIDTTVFVNAGSGTQSVAVPKFVAFDQGISRPFDWRTQAQFQGKVRWVYGGGSRISITGLAGGVQARNTPGTVLGNPSLFSGAHEWTRLVVLNWRQRINEVLVFESVMSLGSDYQFSGALDPSSETATRDPSLGIELSSLDFSTFGSLGIPLDEQIIKDIRTNSGLRVPLLNQTQYRNAQPYRMNPYAMASGGFYTTGVDAPMALSSERRRTGRWELQWQADQRQLVTAGVDADGADLSYYTTNSTINEVSLNAWTASPTRTGLFAQDRFNFGNGTLEFGIRYDHLNPGVELTNTPGFLYSDPAWNASLTSSSADALYQAAVAKVFTPVQAQSFLTPRVRFGWAIDPATSIRAGIGQTVVMPPIGLIAQGENMDLSGTAPGAPFGRDVGGDVATNLDLGFHHAFGAATAVDLAFYDNFGIPNYNFRFQNFNDPTNPGRSLVINALDREPNASIQGVDAAVSHAFGSAVVASVSYGVAVNAFENVTSTVPPPVCGACGTSSAAAATTNTAQELAASVRLAVPDAWASEGWRKALRDVGGVAQFRMISGIPYTPLQNIGLGTLAPGPSPGGSQAGDINSQELPWAKILDLRLTKGVRASGLDWIVFADFRNLLNLQNLYSLYAETNDTGNAIFFHNQIASEFVNLANEAVSNGAYNAADGSVTLGDCSTWRGQAGPVNCVMLKQAEARFGNGDGTYTQAEQTKALTAYYNMVSGASRFFGPQRTIRVGLELAF